MSPARILRLVSAVLVLSPLAGHAQSNSQTIKITSSDCARLVRHNPSADVAYKPGEGVRGKKVAPADLPGSGNDIGKQLLPEVLEIPIQISPMAGKGYATNGLGDSQTTLGTVKYDMNKGTFTLNGQPMGSADQQELANACAKRGVK
ncbi:MAG: hypothetical protein HQL42_01140 [Alphaproteobacteria bacterium]|nr:hypothetical protein [Alphaproteobacteria bacterium]